MSAEQSATLELTPPGAPPFPVLKKTRRRTLSKRGVMWLGQTCNLRCFFCYFLTRIEDNSHPEHPFMELEKAKKICHTMRYVYGNTSVDIQGGEPTIYPGILDLIQYCNEIGLYPTLITNGIHLAKPGILEKFKEAGVRDFLVSLHGIGEIHDRVVQKKNSYEKITQAIARMRELGIPFRFNCTMTKPVVPLLPEIAQRAVDYGARAVNFIVFNVFEDDQDERQTVHRDDEGEAKYSFLKPYLTEAIDKLEKNGIECNVRYLPICMVEPRHRKNIYNYQQLSYDHHEWDYGSWIWTGLQPQRMKWEDTDPPVQLGWSDRRMIARLPKIREWRKSKPNVVHLLAGVQHAMAKLEVFFRGKDALNREEGIKRARDDGDYKYDKGCDMCGARYICDGFHGDYAKHFGTEEAQPIRNMADTTDPCAFIRQQLKVVEPEDESWAL